MRRLAKNFLLIVLSDAGRRVLGFFTVAILARRLTPSDFGLINIGFTVLSYATMIAAGGLGIFGVRSVARREPSFRVGAVIGARLGNSFVALTVVAILMFSVPNQATAALVLLFCISLIPNAFILDWYFQGREVMAQVGAARTVSAAMYLLIAAALVRSPADLPWVAVASILGELTAVLILMSAFRRLNPLERLRPTFAEWKSLTLKAFPLGLGSILAHGGVNLPPLVIGIMMTNADVGIYSAASKLVTFVLMLDRVIATLLLPASARSYNRSADALSQVLSASLKWMVVMGLPLCIGGMLLAGKIVPLVFGVQYAASGDVFSVLIWFVLATLVHTLCTTGLIAAGQEKLYGRTMMAGAAIYLFSTLVLTAAFGVIGSAAAMVCSEVVTVVIMVQRLKRFVQLEVPRSLLKSLAAAGAMAIVLRLFATAHLSISVPAAGLVYALVLYGTRAVTGNELGDLFRRV